MTRVPLSSCVVIGILSDASEWLISETYQGVLQLPLCFPRSAWVKLQLGYCGLETTGDHSRMLVGETRGSFPWQLRCPWLVLIFWGNNEMVIVLLTLVPNNPYPWRKSSVIAAILWLISSLVRTGEESQLESMIREWHRLRINGRACLSLSILISHYLSDLCSLLLGYLTIESLQRPKTTS